MDLAAEHILEHYRHPRGVGSLQHPTVQHRAENAGCGDDLTVELRIDNGVITDVAWKGKGCAISQAGMSMLSEILPGKTREEILEMPSHAMTTLLGVPIGLRRLDCALLGLRAVQEAVGQLDA